MRKTIIALPMVALLLSGCIGKKEYPAEDYLLETSWGEKEEYRILQLGDIHQSQSDLHEDHFKVMDRTIEASKPDMIVLNGDIFTYADKHVVKKVFKYFDDKNKRCSIKCIGCKFFTCDYLRKKGINYKVNSIPYIKYFFNIRQKLICKYSFFTEKDIIINKLLKFYKLP